MWNILTPIRNTEYNTEYSFEDAGDYATTQDPSYVTAAGSTKYGSTLPDSAAGTLEVSDYPSTFQDTREREGSIL